MEEVRTNITPIIESINQDPYKLIDRLNSVYFGKYKQLAPNEIKELISFFKLFDLNDFSVKEGHLFYLELGASLGIEKGKSDLSIASEGNHCIETLKAINEKILPDCEKIALSGVFSPAYKLDASYTAEFVKILKEYITQVKSEIDDYIESLS